MLAQNPNWAYSNAEADEFFNMCPYVFDNFAAGYQPGMD
jgi:hypothetical protein